MQYERELGDRVALSLRTLSPPQLCALMTLAAFSSLFDDCAARAAMGLGEPLKARAMLWRLVDAGVLEALQQSTFRLHLVVRDAARLVCGRNQASEPSIVSHAYDFTCVTDLWVQLSTLRLCTLRRTACTGSSLQTCSSKKAIS